MCFDEGCARWRIQLGTNRAAESLLWSVAWDTDAKKAEWGGGVMT